MIDPEGLGRGGIEKMQVGDFNLRNTPEEVEAAIKVARAAGKVEHARKLEGLLKVLKRIKKLRDYNLRCFIPVEALESILFDLLERVLLGEDVYTRDRADEWNALREKIPTLGIEPLPDL